MTPEISVIVPIYQSEKYLHECIESILEQTFTKFELILINDGSPDRCGDICEEYAKKDRRIIVIHKKNGGASSARNSAIKKSKGKFIMFVDSDDWVDKRILEDLYKQTLLTRSDLCICSEYTQGYDGNYIIKEINTNKLINMDCINDNDLYELIKTYSIYGPCRKLYRTGILKKQSILFDENLIIYEDLLFNLQYLQFTKNISIINKPYYYYRSNPESITRTLDNIKNYKNYSYVSDNLYNFVESIKLFDGNTKKILTTLFVEGYLIYVRNLISRNDITRKEKKITFYELNTWKKLNLHINNYTKYKKIKGIYKYIIKFKNFYLWGIYLTLSNLKRQ